MYSHIQYVQAKDSLSILGYLIQLMVLSVDIALPQLIHVPSGPYIYCSSRKGDSPLY